MKQIYIIDEHISSKQNGVGTYVRCFARLVDIADSQVNILSFNAEVKHFRIAMTGGIRRIDVPFCAQGDFLKLGNLAFPLLSLYIEDKGDNVFFVNHSPCVKFLRAIRANFPKSKIVFVIHDQGWTVPLLGNSESLIELHDSKPIKGVNRSVANFVRRFCNEEKRMYKIVDAVICLSRSTYRLLHEFYNVPFSKIFFIPNCLPGVFDETSVDKKQARGLLHINENEKILLFVGRTTKAKGIIELLKTFERLCKTHDDVRLVIVGEIHSFGDLSKLTPTSSLRITYTGLVGSRQLALWYASADVGVLSSYTEQCSYTALEMMHSPGVIVATSGWGLNEVFHNKNAIIASINRQSNEIEARQFEESLYSALNRALNLKQEETYKLRGQCKELLETRFNINALSLEYKKLINKITSAT